MERATTNKDQHRCGEAIDAAKSILETIEKNA
jgi:hypothetical protein